MGDSGQASRLHRASRESRQRREKNEMRRLRFIIDTLFLIVLNCNFFRVTSAANSTSLTEFYGSRHQVRKRRPFFDPVAVIAVPTAGCLIEISFLITATFSDALNRHLLRSASTRLHRRDLHAEQRIRNEHETSARVLDREQFYVERNLDVVCKKSGRRTVAGATALNLF